MFKNQHVFLIQEHFRNFPRMFLEKYAPLKQIFNSCFKRVRSAFQIFRLSKNPGPTDPGIMTLEELLALTNEQEHQFHSG